MYLASDAAGTGRSQARLPSSPLEGFVIEYIGFVGFRV